ncbi:MAG: relaxase/mobilization nuclease domain-containing protein, partial [Alphaproteobacteria bacterium]|nr:relaxase/mobilization nuclease domain-containing protein [Alphaproteobacteria bacterium]
GTHSNTGNFHMHVAYSKIHPKTFNMHTPFQAYPKMSEVCREMEKKYNLKVDNGYEKTKEKGYEHPHQKAKNFEAFTWQQSFLSYAKEQKKPLIDALKHSKNWQEFHKKLTEHGLRIKRRGNGAVITSLDEKQTIKASDLGREFSKKRLVERFGAFEEALDIEKIKPKKEYKKKPLTKHKNTKNLWKKYQEKKKKPLLKKHLRTWKDFLMYEALSDPMAMAIIIMQRKLIKSIFLTTGNKKPVYVKNNILMSNKPNSKKLSPEELKQRDEQIKEILKQGINSAEDKKLLKEESQRLIASIKYFEENDKQGNWASLKKDRIDEMLKEDSLFPEELKQDTLKSTAYVKSNVVRSSNKPDSKKLSPEDYKQRNKRIKKILDHEISSPEDEKLLKEESKRLAANLQRSKEEGKKGHWAKLKKNRIDRMLKEYSFTPEELKQDILKKMTEGKVVSVPKEIAEELGAFIETAISFDDAKPQKKTQEQEEELKQAAKKVAKDLGRGM